MSMQYRWVTNRKATKEQAISDLADAMVELAKNNSVNKVISKNFSFYENAYEAEFMAESAYPKFCIRDGEKEMNDWPSNVAERWFCPALLIATKKLVAEGYKKS
jgi:hypothetical protein